MKMSVIPSMLATFSQSFSILVCGIIVLSFSSPLAMGELEVEKSDNPVKCKVKPGPHAGKHGSGFGRNFKALDTNGDAYLTFEEFSKSERLARIDDEKKRKLFDFLDQNKDEKLHVSELRPPTSRLLALIIKDFSKWDTDQSGALSFEEFAQIDLLEKMGLRLKKKLFKRLDKNQSKSLGRAELKRGMRPGPGPSAGWGGPRKGWGGRKGHGKIDFEKYDTNQSGGLNFEEYFKIPWMSRIPESRRKALFEKLDKNKDGEISPEEINAAWEDRKKHGPRHHGRPPHEKPQGLPHGKAQTSERGGSLRSPPKSSD